MSRDFWARRKAAVEAEAEAEARAEAEAEAALREEALEEKSDAEILADLELPDPDTLEQGDDFKVFLRDVVPARIRTRALRRLWRLNPVLANIDGLVDYGEDFTDSAMVVEGMQTAYQVGKGMTKHVEELARQASEDEASESAPDTVPDAEDDVVQAEADGAAIEPAAEETPTEDAAEAQPQDMVAEGAVTMAPQAAERRMAVTETAAVEATPVETLPVETLPRRMRFSFETAPAPVRGTA